MNYRELREGIESAEMTVRTADNAANDMAKILVGRLRSVAKSDDWWDHEVLVKLKKELSQYNAKKREWKS